MTLPIRTTKCAHALAHTRGARPPQRSGPSSWFRELTPRDLSWSEVWEGFVEEVTLN